MSDEKPGAVHWGTPLEEWFASLEKGLPTAGRKRDLLIARESWRGAYDDAARHLNEELNVGLAAAVTDFIRARAREVLGDVP